MKKSVGFVALIALLISCGDKEKPIVHNADIGSKLPASVTKLITDAKKDSTNTTLQLQLVNAYDSLAMYKNAIVTLDKLITVDSLNYDFWLRRGQLCKLANDTPAATKSFRYAAKIYPSPIALMELANVYAETKNPLTLSVVQQLMKNNPGGDYNAKAYFFAGVYYSKIGDTRNAIDFFNKSMAQDIGFADAYIEKGYLLYHNKNFTEALKVFEGLITVNITSADGYYWCAKCKEALNDKQKAIELYEKALVLDKNIKEAADALERLKK